MLCAKCTSRYCVINNNSSAYISFRFVLCGSCERVPLGWYINDDRNDPLFFFFFWQLLLNSDELGPLFLLQNWLRGRFTVFYWLYQYPARGVSVLPLPLLPLFGSSSASPLCISSSISFSLLLPPILFFRTLSLLCCLSSVLYSKRKENKDKK